MKRLIAYPSTTLGTGSLKLTAGKQGAILILTFIIMSTLTAITVGFLYMISHQLKGSGYDMASAKAFWLAEAGLQKYVYLLKYEQDYREDYPNLTESLGDGSYSVQASYDEPTSIYTLTSTGTVDVISRKVTQGFEITSALLERGIHADGSLVDFDDSSGTVTGNISCHVSVTNYEGMVITGTITEGLSKINPTLDFAYYESIADHSETTNLMFQNGTYTGIWYTTKKVTIGDNAVINGSIIAEGNIDFTNEADSVTINPSNNYPAIATQGAISSSDTGPPAQRVGLQNSTINGLVLADGNITFNYISNSTFTGTMLSGGNIHLKNGIGITISYNEDIFSPMTPGFTFSGEANIDPQKDWDEVVPAT